MAGEKLSHITLERVEAQFVDSVLELFGDDMEPEDQVMVKQVRDRLKAQLNQGVPKPKPA